MPFEPADYCNPPQAQDQVIWRYLTLQKFMYILQYKALPLVRLDLMPDKFEGSPSQRALERLSSEGSNQELFQGLFAIAQGHYFQNQDNVYVNCWHMAKSESGAMWAQYSNEGVAIESTYELLVQAIAEEPRPINIGCVEYENNDIRLTIGMPRIHVLRKRTYYAYENEVRLIVERREDDIEENSQDGKAIAKSAIDINVDLNVLINRVWISPNQKRLLPLMRDILHTYKLDIEPSASWLGKQPPFRRQ